MERELGFCTKRAALKWVGRAAPVRSLSHLTSADTWMPAKEVVRYST